MKDIKDQKLTKLFTLFQKRNIFLPCLILLLVIFLSSSCSTTMTTQRTILNREELRKYGTAMSEHNTENEGFRFYVSERVRLKLLPGVYYEPLYDEITAIRRNTEILDRRTDERIDIKRTTPGRRLQPFNEINWRDIRIMMNVSFERIEGIESPLQFIMQRRHVEHDDDKFYFHEPPTTRERPLHNKFVVYNGRVYELMKPYGLFYMWEKPFPEGEEPYLEFRLTTQKGSRFRIMQGIE